MKTIIVGDIHGRSTWKLIEHLEQPDKIIFIGDYWDSFDIPFKEQRKNFQEIIEYKRNNLDKVVLLIGNHDFHYMRIARSVGEYYSGFQDKYQFLIKDDLEEVGDVLQIAYIQDSFLFTHAGVTKTWLRLSMGLPKGVDVEMDVDLEEYINNVFKYTPKHFFFNGNDPYGDDIEQSPIWVRPDSLMLDAIDGYKQVVGHTAMGTINPDGIDGRFFFIDTLMHGEYLIIENGITKKGKI